jgi:hypothetical protein
MRFPNMTGAGVYPYGIWTSSLTGGGVAQNDYAQAKPGDLFNLLGVSGDVNFRVPLLMGNRGNKIGKGRLLGAMAMSSGVALPGDAKITCYSAGYISDDDGAGVLPRGDYFQGYGQIAPQAIQLPVGTFVPFAEADGSQVIGRSGFLFNISGTSPVVAIYHEEV